MKTGIEQLKRKLVKKFHQATATYHLLEDGDRILVGLSGGKDSLLLLELLAGQARIHRPRFEVMAMHIRMSNVRYETDTEYLERFAANLGVRLYVETTGFQDRNDGNKKPVCFLCSWYRRKMLFNKAQELGCNKIALGHHLDDIIHTSLMNIFFQGQFASMPARLKMRRMPLTIIRPLCYEDECDILRYAQLAGYEKQVKLCPYETASHREDVKRIFRQVEEMNTEARHSILNALESAGKMTEE